MQITIKTKALIDKKHPELCLDRCPHWRIFVDTGRVECRVYDEELYQTAYKDKGRYRYLRCRECRVNFLRV
jgi:hypothetical protein